MAKMKFSYITDTVFVNGIYQTERRDNTERRYNKNHWVCYERRQLRDPRLPTCDAIDEYL
jgi:hypothetical protein